MAMLCVVRAQLPWWGHFEDAEALFANPVSSRIHLRVSFSAELFMEGKIHFIILQTSYLGLL